MLATTDAVLKGKRTGGQATTGACLRERAAEVTRRTALRRRGRGFSTCSTSTRTTTTTWSTQRTPTRTSVQANAQSSRTEYEGDLSASLLLGLSDAELENLASEYEYDIESKKLGGELVFEGDDEVEVDAHYEGISDEEAEAESRAFALTLADALDEVKVQDIKLLHVGPYCSWCTYFVVASVFSRPQLDAALDRVSKAALEKEERRSLNTERPGRTEWECIDFGDVVVHIMTPRQRQKYDLEGYYSKATIVDYEARLGQV